MRRVIIGWALWALAVATIVVFLTMAEQSKRQSEQFVPRHVPMDQKILD